MLSTLEQPDVKLGARWIASAPVAVQERFLNELSRGAVGALLYLFDFWALPHQLPPEGAWRTWIVMGGRGAGKTRAGAEWVRSLVEGAKPFDEGRCRKVALVGETYDQVREVMIFGESGLLACSPPDRRPEWNASRRRLVWPNGAEAFAFSASDPEALRGPQFDAAWADELGKWKKAQACWDMLQFALRLGDDPRACVTTTPRNVDVLKTLIERETSVMTQAATEANRANLAEGFLKEVRLRYAGTRLGRQELDGVLLEDVQGALWSADMLDGAQGGDVPALDRVVVSVDPATTSGAGSDACGIIVAGVKLSGAPENWRAYVLADRTVQGASPIAWARAAISAMDEFQADRMVAEVNQGGDLVKEVIRSVDPNVPLCTVHATRGKIARAEPVAALYEQGRVSHGPDLQALEAQMSKMTRLGYAGDGSPDRVDALVWALHELIIRPQREMRRPGIRPL